MQIQKWIDELRSGHYRQTKNELFTPENRSYCCLGVLCDIADVPEKEMAHYEGVDLLNLDGAFDEDIHKICDEYPAFLIYLSWMNDFDFSFNMIASEIEAFTNGDRSRFNIYLNDGVTLALAALNSYYGLEVK